MNLSDYVKKRNGVPIGHSKSLSNNLYRRLGLKTLLHFGLSGIQFLDII